VGSESGNPILGIILLALALLTYFLPSIVAGYRKHRNTTAIFVLNLLGGWTGVIWLGALVWSLLEERK